MAERKETLSYKKGYIRGVLYGDGYFHDFVSKHTYGTYIYRGAVLDALDKEMVNTVANFAKTLFGVKSILHFHSSRRYWRWKTLRKSFVLLIEKWMPSSHEEWRGFIAGLFDAEGSNCNHRYLSFTLKGISKNISLLRKVAKQLQWWGFAPRIATYVEKKKRSAYMGISKSTKLGLRVFKNASKIHKMPNSKRRRLREEMLRKFFMTFQPKIKRKWPSGETING